MDNLSFPRVRFLIVYVEIDT